MEAQGASLHGGRWALLLLLLGLATPLATAQVLSQEEAALLAVEEFNRNSSEESLYRLLQLDQQPDGDENPNTLRPVSFVVKETVCPRRTQLPPEQCDFKENGLMKECVGLTTLDQKKGYFEVNCVELKDVKLRGLLGGLLRKGGRKIGEGIEGFGRRIKNFFSNLSPREES
ncbi:PREDICTED: cathelicidin antimicrobial peptide [Miniopterus natalensis]|uniref:cathelicidin antimicrobial peptide n=1 Tax=Miniopterus natalensis TaxID=291302 RepID=UPI0007A70636|nr:PREDICTED: cathelicidin antimicrobial peptide [Miniopterus natalensis]